MKLKGTVELFVRGETVLRDPTFWDKFKRTFGARPNLDTGHVRAALEATALVEGTRRALERLGASNAIALVIDEQVLFEDKKGRKDDLSELFLAFHDNASVFGQGFKSLRLAVEHEEAGLHLVIEVIARGEHPKDEAAARVVVAGRIQEFEPRPGEDAETYRARVEPRMQSPALPQLHTRQFEGFMTRLADAMQGAMPDARVELKTAEAQVQKPERQRGNGRQPPPPQPNDARYDPYGRYFPAYGMFDMALSMMFWSSIMSWGMRPDVVVVNHVGDPVGNVQDADMTADADMGDVGGDIGDDVGADGGVAGDAGDMGGDAGDMGGDAGDFGGDMDFGGGDW